MCAQQRLAECVVESALLPTLSANVVLPDSFSLQVASVDVSAPLLPKVVSIVEVARPRVEVDGEWR